MSQPGSPGANTIDLSAMRVKMLERIAKLAQWPHLQPHHVERWVNSVLEREPDRALWHVDRLQGIGGSEIGPLLIEARGEHSHLESAYDVIASKLLMFPVKQPKDIMRRGTETEPLIRQMFLAQYGARQDSEALARMKDVASPLVPWLRGNPDDIVQIGGKRILVDYKSPGEDGIEEMERHDQVPLTYGCQLHHYRTNCEHQGVRIDGMLLVSLDWKKWALDVREIEYEPQLEAELIAVGNHYWTNHVLQGCLPDFKVTEIVTPRGEDLERLQLASHHILLHKAAAKEHESRAEQLGRVLTDSTREGYVLGEAKMPLGALELTSKLVIDEEEVLLRLERQGLPAESFMVRDRLDTDKVKRRILKDPGLLEKFADCLDERMDFEKAIEALRAQGEDVSACRHERHSIAVTRKQKGVEAEIAAMAKDFASQTVSQFPGDGRQWFDARLEEIREADALARQQAEELAARVAQEKADAKAQAKESAPRKRRAA